MYLSPSLPAFLCKFVYVDRLGHSDILCLACLPESVYLSVVFIFLFLCFLAPTLLESFFALVSVFCGFSVFSLFVVGLLGFDQGLWSCRLISGLPLFYGLPGFDPVFSPLTFGLQLVPPLYIHPAPDKYGSHSTTNMVIIVRYS